jgi:DNA-directed RNA polymerase delta subunit
MKIDNFAKTINVSQEQLFSSLNEREQGVLISRYGTDGDKKTLSAIGQNLKLSRERIRQIENRAKSKLVKYLNETNSKYFEVVASLILNNGGFISENSVAENLSSDGIKVNYFKLLLDINPELDLVKGDNWLGRAWRHKTTDQAKINSVINSVEQKLKETGESLDLDDLIKELEVKPGFDRSLFLALCNATNKFMIKKNRIGLTSDRSINPKTVADKVLYILEEAKRPIHFAEIAEEIGNYGFDKKKINKSTVHNELIANDKFVLIGRGIYAMKKWGYRNGTLEELIVDFLKDKTEPQTISKIIEHINRERTVKRNTILVNLAKSEIIKKMSSGYAVSQK